MRNKGFVAELDGFVLHNFGTDGRRMKNARHLTPSADEVCRSALFK